MMSSVWYANRHRKTMRGLDQSIDRVCCRNCLPSRWTCWFQTVEAMIMIMIVMMAMTMVSQLTGRSRKGWNGLRASINFMLFAPGAEF